MLVKKSFINIGTDAIGRAFALPLNAVTEKLAFLGRTGAGKTYAAGKVAEEMLAAKAQVVILDPVGNWYGLRLAKDGVSPGISIPVFGGLHGDVPLEPTAGALLADLIVDRGISVIMDVSQFEHDTDKSRFAAAWSNRFFFRKKAEPSAVHVILEEAQEFIPEKQQRGEELMLHAFHRMWKLGRNFGIGGSLISQRPQEVSKKALNLSECVFAFQLTGPHERDAIEKWTAEKGVDEDINAILPKLPKGTARVWSPSWLQIAENIAIGEKETFNASATPEVGRAAIARELAPVDLEQIRKAMAATIERAKADDPRELRNEIANLRKQLKATPVAKPIQQTASSKEELSAEHSRGWKGGIAHAEREAYNSRRTAWRALKRVQEANDRTAKAVMEELAYYPESGPEKPKAGECAPVRAVVAPIAAVAKVARRMPLTEYSQPTIAETDGALSTPEQRIIDALAWLESIGVAEPENPAVSFVAGYTLNGSYFNARGALRGRGLLVYLDGSRLQLTNDGRARARMPEVPGDAEALQNQVLSKLPTQEQRVLKPLIEAYPESVDNAALAQAANYTLNGSFFNARGRLKSLGLVEYVKNGVRARALLFPE